MKQLIGKLLVGISIALLTLAASAQSGKVVWYSQAGPDLTVATIKAFEGKYPNIKVEAIQMESGPMLARVKAERSKPQADFVSGSPAEFKEIEDLLLSYRVKEHDKYPASAVGPDNAYYNFSINIYTFLVNTKSMALDQAPKSWKDLADPKYKGKLVIANPAISAGSYFTFAQQLQLYGWEHMKKVIDNAVFVNSTQLVFTNVSKGEHAIGLTEESKAWERVDQGFPVKVIYPAEGTGVNYASYAVLRNSPNPANAKLFADFVTSQEGANLNVSVRNRRSTRPDNLTPKGIPVWAEVKQLPNYNEVKATAEYPNFVKLFEVEFSKKR